ncbi:MAG: ribosome-associated translation inhibitor RaiA [Bdellovibrionales bacterium]|jgi:ribosomal subunit interface protein|nr:ribosome-associated translation inhibitor RaiA [Bdellovibrionales bacterium]
MLHIISEDFDLTPSIREGIQERVEQVNEVLRKEHAISVYLTKTSGELFTVRINVRVGRKDLTSSDTNRDFYQALNAAKDHLLRQVDRQNKRRIAQRHRQN